MVWPPNIAGELPAPRDDEPSSLRQDIADELADHLVSAFNRELHFTPEETAAKQTVLNRFGDPRRVARQLWFDVLKEKIMSQRVLIGALILTAFACLASTGLTCMLVQQSRQVNEALLNRIEQSRKANEAMLEQSRATNVALLEKLSSMALAAPAAVEPARSMEWNSVKIRLVKDAIGGAPAEGYAVRLHGFLLDTAKEIEIRRTTGADGVADLGLVRPGQHELNVWTPWNEARPKSTLTVLPGQSVLEDIVCPGAQREETVATFAVNWPDELREKKYWLVGHLSQKWREVDGTSWSGPSDLRDWLVIVNGDGVAAAFVMDRKWGRTQAFGGGPFDFSTAHDRLGGYVDFGIMSGLRRAGGPRGSTVEDGDSGSSGGSPPTARPYQFNYPLELAASNGGWPAGSYAIKDLLIGVKSSKSAREDWQTLDVVGALVSELPLNFSWQQINVQQIQNSRRGGQGARLPTLPKITDWIDVNPGESGTDDVRFSNRRDAAQPVFELKPKVENEIRIPVPQRLKDNVVTFLQAGE